MQTIIKPKNSYALFKAISGLLLSGFLFSLALLIDVIIPSSISKYVLSILPMISFILIGVSLLFLIVFCYKYIYTTKTFYILDSDNIRYKRGIFTIKEDNVKLYRVKDIVINRPFFLRLLNTMNITLLTSDKSHPELHLTGVPNSDLANEIDRMVEFSRKKNNVYEID